MELINKWKLSSAVVKFSVELWKCKCHSTGKYKLEHKLWPGWQQILKRPYETNYYKLAVWDLNLVLFWFNAVQTFQLNSFGQTGEEQIIVSWRTKCHFGHELSFDKLETVWHFLSLAITAILLPFVTHHAFDNLTFGKSGLKFKY